MNWEKALRSDGITTTFFFFCNGVGMISRSDLFQMVKKLFGSESFVAKVNEINT